MTRFTRRTTQLAAALTLGLLAALPLPQAVAQSEHEGHHPQNAPAAAKQAQGNMGKSQQMPQGGMMDHSQMNHGQMMDHGSMDHQQMMQQMHEQHMNHGSMPPAQTAPATKDGKDGQ